MPAGEEKHIPLLITVQAATVMTFFIAIVIEFTNVRGDRAYFEDGLVPERKEITLLIGKTESNPSSMVRYKCTHWLIPYLPGRNAAQGNKFLHGCHSCADLHGRNHLCFSAQSSMCAST